MDSSILSVSLVDLPGLIQSIASRRRSGVLTVGHRDNGQERNVRFGAGMINAVTGGDADAFGKALVWAGVLTLPQYHASLLRVGDHCPPEKLLKALVNAKVVTTDGVLDALDCYIEEEFTTILGWQQPVLSFNEVIIADEWGSAQAKTGLAVNPGSMLLESLRRQDELGTIAELLPDQWDALFRVPSVPAPENLHADAKRILADWTDGTAVNAVLDHPTLPPFRSKLALGILFRHGLLRVANVNELVVEADAAYANGFHEIAYGLYRRTLGYGMDNARIHMHLAELAERFGDKAAAAASFMAAAQQLSDPNATVVALRNALRLGADKEAVLTQMVALNLQLGSDADTVSNMLLLAEFYSEKGSQQQAIQSVREAQELGADRGTTALMIARFSRAEGDTEQAALQLELAARAFHENDRTDQAIKAWRELLKLLPGRCEYAKECAELLVWTGQKAEAIAVLREALSSQKDSGEDILLQIYELLSQLDPSNVDAHDWLASAYERRRDRDGATKQLKLSAQAQEKAQDFVELATTKADAVADPLSGEMTADILRNVVKFGTGRRAMDAVRMGEKPVVAVGKTGTTNEYKNVAFVGMVPKSGSGGRWGEGYTIAAYVGYDDNHPMKRGSFKVQGASGALPVWIATARGMADAGLLDPAPEYTPSPGLTRVPVPPATGMDVAPDALVPEGGQRRFALLTQPATLVPGAVDQVPQALAAPIAPAAEPTGAPAAPADPDLAPPEPSVWDGL